MKLLILLLITNLRAETPFQKNVNEIISRNGELNQIQSVVEARESKLLSSKLSFLPDLNVGYSKSRYYGDEGYDADNLFVRSTINLFKGGGDFSNYQGVKALYEESKALERNTYLTAERNAVEILLTYYENLKKFKIAKEFLDHKEISLKTSDERYKRGLTSIQEVNKTKIDFLNAKAQLTASEVEVQKSKAVIIEKLGNDVIDFKDWPLKKVISSLNNQKILTQEVNLEKRPDVKALEMKLKSDESNIKTSKRSLMPKVDLSYTWSDGRYDRFARDERSAVLSVSLPLFEGWKTMSQVDELVSYQVASTYKLRDIKREINAKWLSVKENLISLVKTANEREETLGLARDLYKDNFKRFREGRVTVNDLQLDQNRLLDSENLANNGWFLVHMSYLEFCHEQGLSVFQCE